MRKTLLRKTLALIIASLILLTACNTDDDTKDGRLSINIVDAPIDGAQHVYIQFSGIELHGPTGTHTLSLNPPKKLDLLTYNGTNDTALLNDYALPAGEYQWIRLMVDTAGNRDSYIVTSAGASYELTIPSGDETGLKLNRGFTLAQGGIASFTIDFDLRRSIIQAAGSYKLKPTLRIENKLETGSLRGTITTNLISANCSANEYGVVYIYSGSTTPDDIDGDANDPITSAQVSNNGSMAYSAGFLAPGTYTAAWTCQADNDDPTQNDTLQFLGTSSVTIVAKQPTTLNFGS